MICIIGRMCVHKSNCGKPNGPQWYWSVTIFTPNAVDNDVGVEIIAQGPQALAAITKSDLEKWGPIVQKAGVKLD